MFSSAKISIHSVCSNNFQEANPLLQSNFLNSSGAAWLKNKAGCSFLKSSGISSKYFAPSKILSYIFLYILSFGAERSMFFDAFTIELYTANIPIASFLDSNCSANALVSICLRSSSYIWNNTFRLIFSVAKISIHSGWVLNACARPSE